MHNLQFDLFDEQASSEEVSAIIDEIAQKVCGRKMESAVVLFLEMHRPLAFIAGQSMIAASPFLVPIFGQEGIYKYSQVLGSRENVEKLIDRIEQAADERESMEKLQKTKAGDAE